MTKRRLRHAANITITIATAGNVSTRAIPWRSPALMQALSKNEAESAKFGAEIETKKRELFEAKLRIKMLEESLILAQGAS